MNAARDEATRLLLVDDDAREFLLILALLGQAFRSDRVDLDWERDRDRARDLIATGAYDAALISDRLGRRAGLDLIEEVVSTGCSTPMILMSGRDDPELEEEALCRGAADFLDKRRLSVAWLRVSLRHALAGARNAQALGPMRVMA